MAGLLPHARPHRASSDVEAARAAHPGAKVVVHPECRPEVAAIADAVESTSGMIRFCREDDAKEYLIGTELGMIYRLAQGRARQALLPGHRGQRSAPT